MKDYLDRLAGDQEDEDGSEQLEIDKTNNVIFNNLTIAVAEIKTLLKRNNSLRPSALH